MKILTIMGTRPEAIKLAPVVKALAARPDIFDSKVLVTGQHREMLDQALAVFALSPDFDLDLMETGQDLFAVSSRLLKGVGRVLALEKPDFILVQGDTATTMVSALAAFYHRIPVGHIEAGLRTFNKYQPFPEEINRRLTGVLAELNFVPTKSAKENLRREGVAPEKIFHTGNTIVDALKMILKRRDAGSRLNVPLKNSTNRLVLVTAHRRENWGEPLDNITTALNYLISNYRDIEIVFPVHLNPMVREAVISALEDVERVHLIEPCDYADFVRLMSRSYLILTDSGGIQEEALSLGKPVLVMREVTERPESIEFGASTLVGTDPVKITAAADVYLADKIGFSAAKSIVNPYGDGRAAQRIVNILIHLYAGGSLDDTADFSDSFEVVL